MGCSSSLNTTNQNSSNSAKITSDSKSDAKILKLISAFQDAINSGEINQQRSSLYEMKQNALELSQNSANPSQVVDKLLDLVLNTSTPQFQKEITHTAQLFVHQVYVNKKDGAPVAQNVKTAWIDKITSIRNVISKSMEKSELEFELDCCEACIKILGEGQSDTKMQVFDFITQIGQCATGDYSSKDYSSVITLGKSIISKLGEVTFNKIDEKWVLPVITNYYTLYLMKNKPDLIQTILDQLKLEHEWHITYSGLDVLENFLEINQTLNSELIEVLTKLSSSAKKIKETNQWRIRDKVAKICIRAGEPHASQLQTVYIKMLATERDLNVRRTLNNEAYIKKQKKQLQDCWEKNQASQEQEISAECLKLGEIQKLLEGKETSPEQKEMYEQELKDIKENVRLLQNMEQLIEVKSNSLEALQHLIARQDQVLSQISNSLQKVEQAVCGRNAQQLVKSIFDYYMKESENWKPRLSMYIPEKAVTSINDVEDLSKAVDVDEQFSNFLKNDEQKVMLIQGGAGTGKTIYCQYLITQLLQSKQIVPVYISLPQLQNWEKQMVEETLSELRFSQTEILTLQQSKTHLLFVVDGYDEVRSYKRLYDPNSLLNWNCKALFTCRSSHLANDKFYYKYFISAKFELKMFADLTLVHFDDKQIQDYLQRFCAKLEQNSKLTPEWKSWKTYQNNINQVPGLRALVQNPFILSMIVSVLPNIMQKHDTKQTLTSLDLYEAFVQQWFELEEERMYTNNVNTDVTNLQKEYRDYSYRLASKMMDSVKTVVEYNKDDKQNPWRQFFDQNDPRVTTVRRGVPLNISQRFYSFIHKSIQEYFVAKNGQKSIELIADTYDEKLLDCSINTHNIVDRGVFGFYSQIILRFPEFKHKLYKVIEMSKTNQKVSIAAANAITILNCANESFKNADFRNIKIPGANLSLAMMDGADLSGADLSNVDLQSAWLQKAKFDNANMKNVEFGQRAYVDSESFINKVKFNKCQDIFACANGYVQAYKAQKVEIYNCKTLEKLCTIDHHQDDVTGIAFSPNGKQFISCSKDNTINIYNVEKWQILKSIPLDCEVVFVDYTKDDKYIICGSGRFVFLYSADDYSLVNTFGKHYKNVITVEFSNDCQYFVSAGEGFFQVWEVESGIPVQTVEDIDNTIYHAVFSPDDSQIVCAFSDNTIKIWNFKSYDSINVLRGHASKVMCLAFSPNGQYLVSGCEDGTMILWDAKSFEIIKSMNAHVRLISSIQFLNDNETVMSGSWDGLVKFTSIKSVPLIKSLPGHAGEIARIQYSNNFKFIVSCSMDSTIKLWNPIDGSLIKTLFGHDDVVCAVSLTKDDKFMLSTSRDSQVKLWNMESFKCVRTFQLDSPSFAVDFHIDNQMFALAGFDKAIHIFDITKNREIKYLKQDDEIMIVKYSHDCQKLTATGPGANLYIVDMTIGETVVKVKDFEMDFFDLAFSEDDQFVYACERPNPKSMRMWDINGKLIREQFSEAEYSEIFEAQQTSPDGKRVKIFKNCVQQTDAKTGEMLWISGEYTLNMLGCSFEGVQNISQENKMLMEQYRIAREKII
ncbi:Pentapeptide_repeats-containing protein [Hexamita inflata]|uniref:Pentapeptide repeats-containing protein n=1 Tax=Hexamita inflata TaxID=28002 RepID=A0AA86PA99_9EUKA|nr:Pentapeptide repeats-containing protein [Hexamita inflata]